MNREIIHGQDHEGYCGPACITAIANKLGLPIRQEIVAKMAKTTKEEGTSHRHMIRAVEMLGMSYIESAGVGLDDLKEYSGQVILNHMNGRKFGDGHYSILLDADENTVTLADPDFMGRTSIWDRRKFESVWFDFTEKGAVHKWALIITGKE